MPQHLFHIRLNLLLKVSQWGKTKMPLNVFNVIGSASCRGSSVALREAKYANQGKRRALSCVPPHHGLDSCALAESFANVLMRKEFLAVT